MAEGRKTAVRRLDYVDSTLEAEETPSHLTQEQADLHEDVVAAMSAEVAAAREELISSGGKWLSKEKSPAGTIARCRKLHPTWVTPHQRGAYRAAHGQQVFNW